MEFGLDIERVVMREKCALFLYIYKSLLLRCSVFELAGELTIQFLL